MVYFRTMFGGKRTEPFTVSGLFSLTNPITLPVVFVLVVLGASLPAGGLDIPAFFVAGGIFSLIAAGGYVTRDVAYLAVDKVNRPGKPLPSGRVSLRMAVLLSAVLFSVGLLGSAFLGVRSAAAGLLYIALTFFHNGITIGKGLIGNITGALLVPMALVFGWTVTDGPFSKILFPILFFFLYNLAREIYKDAANVFGGRVAGLRTIAVVQGLNVACNISTVIIGVLILITPLPYLLGIYSAKYLAFFVPLDALIFYLAVQNLRRFDEHRVIFTHNFMKVLALIAAGGIYWGASNGFA